MGIIASCSRRNLETVEVITIQDNSPSTDAHYCSQPYATLPRAQTAL